MSKLDAIQRRIKSLESKPRGQRNGALLRDLYDQRAELITATTDPNLTFLRMLASESAGCGRIVRERQARHG